MSGRCIDIVFQPLYGPDGAISGVLVQSHDVAEQKQPEDAADKSEFSKRPVAMTAKIIGSRNRCCRMLSKNAGSPGYRLSQAPILPAPKINACCFPGASRWTSSRR